MAITFDSEEQATNASTDTLTITHTGTGSNLAAVVYTLGSATSDKITGVTYDGVAMTKLDVLPPSTYQNRYSTTWYLSNVPAGAKDVVATASGVDFIRMYVVTYAGVASGASDANTTKGDTAGTTSPTFTITTVADNCWISAFFSADGSGTFSDGTNYKERDGTAGADRGIGDTNSAQTPAGSKTLTATNSSADGYVVQGVSFAPAAGTVTNSFLLMGV